MRRALTALALGAALASAAAAPADAAPDTAPDTAPGAKKAPKPGAWTCENGGTVPFATLELFKGNKYAANGDTEKGKYVYKAGQSRLKFKSGVWEGLYYGEYAKDTLVITLFSVESTDPEAICHRDDSTDED